jgi:hypothetical protein
MKDAEQQLEALRAHLLSLGKAESQIQAIKEKSVDLGPATVTENNLSVVEILQVCSLCAYHISSVIFVA